MDHYSGETRLKLYGRLQLWKEVNDVHFRSVVALPTSIRHIPDEQSAPILRERE